MRIAWLTHSRPDLSGAIAHKQIIDLETKDCANWLPSSRDNKFNLEIRIDIRNIIRRYWARNSRGYRRFEIMETSTVSE